VVTEIRAATGEDDLALEIFGDVFPATPEPARADDKLAPEPEPEPEPAAAAVPEPEARAAPEPEPVARRLDPAAYRDRLGTDSTRHRSRFGVRVLGEGLQGPTEEAPTGAADIDHSTLGTDAQGASLDDLQDPAVTHGLASPDEGWFEPFEVAGGLDETMFEPPVRPQYAPPQGTTGYAAPLPEERSAARPALVGTDLHGNPYTTGDQPNPALAARAGTLILARSGDLLPAVLLYGFNSDDVRGLPIYGVIQDHLPSGRRGPLHGARIQGQVAYSSNNAAVIFDTLLLANGREFPIDAIAVSLVDGQTGVAAEVDRHRLARYGSLFLSGIIQGVGEVGLARLREDDDDQPIIVINEGDGSVVVERDRNEIDEGELLAGALAPVGRNLSAATAQGFDRPPTISAPAGYPFAVVFTSTLISDPAEARTAFNPRTGQIEVVTVVTEQEPPAAPVGAAGPANAPVADPVTDAAPALTIPGTGEAFTPAGEGPPDAVWQSLTTGQ
jgi:hypothetical protein